MGERRARVNVGGVAVTPMSPAELVDYMVAAAGLRRAGSSRGDGRTTVGYMNAHVFNLCRRDERLREALAGFSLVWPDGVSGRLACRLAGVGVRERLGGYYFLDRLGRAMASAGRRVFLLGSTDEAVAGAAGVLAERFGEGLVAGWHNGYFGPQEEAAVAERINASGADAVAVGMGSPRQELWAARQGERLAARLVWTVGALFDFMTGSEPPAPAWVRAVNAEWLWRLCLDPAGKWRRYVLGNPRFLWQLLRERPRVIGEGE